MRFVVVSVVFCMFFTVFSADVAAQDYITSKKHKHWWENGYQSGATYQQGQTQYSNNGPSSAGRSSVGGDWAGPETGYKKDLKRHYRSGKKYLFGIPNDDNMPAYFTDPKGPQNTYYEQDGWSPEAWADGRGNARAVIDDFYNAKVITDQYDDKGVPVLEVGQPFLDLSFQDKRRVAEYVDHVYNMTGRKGMYRIVFDDWYQTAVGVYNKEGLKLQ